MPVLPSWLTEPLWDQFAALLPERPVYARPSAGLSPPARQRPDHLRKTVPGPAVRLLLPGDRRCTCSATTIRDRRDEWIKAGIFARLKQIALDSYDRIVGLLLEQVAVDGCITKAPGGGEAAGRSPVDRGKQGLKRSGMTDGLRNPAGPRSGPSEPSRLPAARPDPGQTRRPGTAARRHPRAPGRRLRLQKHPRPAERTWTARPHRPQRREGTDPGQPEMARRTDQRLAERLSPPRTLLRTPDQVIDAFFDLADAIITVRSLIRQAWTTHRWDNRPARRP